MNHRMKHESIKCLKALHFDVEWSLVGERGFAFQWRSSGRSKWRGGEGIRDELVVRRVLASSVRLGWVPLWNWVGLPSGVFGWVLVGKKSINGKFGRCDSFPPAISSLSSPNVQNYLRVFEARNWPINLMDAEINGSWRINWIFTFTATSTHRNRY